MSELPQEPNVGEWDLNGFQWVCHCPPRWKYNPKNYEVCELCGMHRPKEKTHDKI